MADSCQQTLQQSRIENLPAQADKTMSAQANKHEDLTTEQQRLIDKYLHVALPSSANESSMLHKPYNDCS